MTNAPPTGHNEPMLRHVALSSVLVGALFASGCTPGACGGDVLEAYLCGADVVLEVGTGEASFEPVTDGIMHLHPGFQGAQHLFVSARGALDTTGLAVARAEVVLDLFDATTAERLVDPLSFGFPYQREGEQISLTGALLVVEDPSLVLDQQVVIGVEVTPVGASETARGALEARVSWAP